MKRNTYCIPGFSKAILLACLCLICLPASGQSTRTTYLGADLYSLRFNTLRLNIETRVLPALGIVLDGGYTFPLKTPGISNSRDNLLRGGFFQFGPRFRIRNGNEKDLFYIGIMAGSSFYRQNATLEIGHNYGTATQEYGIRGNTAGFVLQQGFSFRPLPGIQIDAGADLGMLRPRTDVLGQEIYYQPGFGYVDKSYFGNRERIWQNTLTFKCTIIYMLNRNKEDKKPGTWVYADQ